MQEDKSTAAGRFIKAKPNTVKKLQDYGLAEVERNKKKKAEEAKSKKAGINTAPSKGIFEKMYDSVMGEKKKK